MPATSGVMSLTVRITLFLMVMVSCVSCDLTTKAAAYRTLRERPPVLLLGGTVQLRYAENTGGFLSVGDDLPQPIRWLLFVSFSALVVITLSVVTIAGSSLNRTKVIGCALVAAGGLGNLVDRVTRGSTRDWAMVQAGSLHTGVFNLADVAIMAGIAMLFLAYLPGAGRRAGPEERQPAA
jgi:signal peptidase II